MTAPYIFKLSNTGVEHLQEHPEDRELVEAMAHPVTGFREFLKYWYFRPPGEDPRILGDAIWSGQEQFIEKVREHDWIFLLKAAQIGFTTIEVAYDGWVMRFRGVNERVHIYSKREDAAQGYLEQVKFGLENLPAWLQFPVVRETLNEYVIGGIFGDELLTDKRMVKAYPSDKDTSRGDPCTHAHVDEWAFMGDPRRVWQAIEPRAHGTCHILTTGQGPENYTSGHWRRCLAGDARHAPVFIGALQRPDRTAAWLAQQRASLGDERAALQEYPLTWEDAISGGGEYVFTSEEIDAANHPAAKLGPPIPDTKYSKGVDIGRHKDAAVLIGLEIRGDVKIVRAYRRLRENTYPEIQHEIEQMDTWYPGPLGVEKNSAGEAVLENLNLPERRIAEAKFITSNQSKARIISQLKLELQNQTLKYSAEECPQLDTELRGYQTPDENVVQDSVIALAIAVEYCQFAYSGGRVLKILQV